MGIWQICPELTNNCNYSCVLCPHSLQGNRGPSGNTYNREVGWMSEQTWSWCLRNAGVYSRELSLGFFGEQMLHPEFWVFLQMIPAGRKYRVVLNTNWSLIETKDMPALNRYVNEVRISIDTLMPDRYAQICGAKGGIIDGLGNVCNDGGNHLDVIEDKVQAFVSQPHPKTKLIFTISSYNCDEVQQFVRYWTKKLPKQDCVCVKSAISFGGIMDDRIMRRSRCRTLMERRVVVSWDGRLSPCNLDTNMALEFGNTSQSADMMALVRNDVYKARMREIKSKQGICRNCFDGNNRRLTRTCRGTL